MRILLFIGAVLICPGASAKIIRARGSLQLLRIKKGTGIKFPNHNPLGHWHRIALADERYIVTANNPTEEKKPCPIMHPNIHPLPPWAR